MPADYTEYLVTLRVQTEAETPAHWNWVDLTGEQFIAVEQVRPTGQVFIYDEEAGLVLVDLVAEPERLLGQWVNISWDNGVSMIAEVGHLEEVTPNCLWVIGPPAGSSSHVVLRESVKTITPGRDPKKRG